MLALLDYARAALTIVVAGGGCFLMLGAAIGLLRFPDAFTRLHAGGVTMATGAVLALIGLLVLSNSLVLSGHLMFLILLIVVAGPLLSHVVGRAAHAAGLTPIVGAYTAPRPGARVGD